MKLFALVSVGFQEGMLLTHYDEMIGKGSSSHLIYMLDHALKVDYTSVHRLILLADYRLILSCVNVVVDYLQL